ncbi:MAG: hypothetical protein HJJLKODD_01112 [Phycisphaerae bacterium]|nr:hypothetical protein [Phycisphaerae bacterium]
MMTPDAFSLCLNKLPRHARIYGIIQGKKKAA